MLMFWLASMTHPTSVTNRVEEMNSKTNNVGVELFSDSANVKKRNTNQSNNTELNTVLGFCLFC